MILAAPARAVKSQFGDLTPGPFPNREGEQASDISGRSGECHGASRESPLPGSGRGRGLGISRMLAERTHGREGEPEWREQLAANGGE
jgi:hypothetical protein